MPDAASSPTPSASPTPVARLVRLVARERAELGVVTVYAALAGLLGLVLPLGVQAIIGLIAGGMLLQPAVLLVGFVVLGTLAAGVMQVLQLAAVERMQQRIFARLALDWSRRLPRVPLATALGRDLPELTNRFFEVVTIQKGLAKLLTDAIAALLAIAAGLVLLTFYHPSLGLTGLLLLAGLAGVLWLTGRGGLRTSLAESSYKYHVASWLQELARRVGAFQLAGATPLPLARMDAEVAGYLGARQAHFRVLVRQSLAAVLFKTLVTGGLLVLGASLVVRRQITLGQFVASELVVVGMLTGVENVIRSLSTIYDVLTAVEKAGHVEDVPLAPRGGTAALPPRAPAGRRLELRGVGYRYPDAAQPALADVTLRVEPGDVVAVTGAEGAGESTLLRLIAGLHDGYTGAVLVDGVSLRDADPRLVRREVALVEPTAELFAGTLEENVTMGRPDVTAADVLAALQLADLGDFVHALPAGLRTRVGGGALRLPSHVQRKLMLARAVAGRPGLLLFDEFFHHLEPPVRRRVIGRLLAPGAGWTIVAASHDAVFLTACGRVHVLAQGRLVRDGTLAELLQDPAVAALVRAPDPDPTADADVDLAAAR